MSKRKTDFFISYTEPDEEYAVWIDDVLKKEGYTTIIQAWDFRPGDNFISGMNYGLINSERFIAVLSSKYFKSTYCELEWTTAIALNSKKGKRLFIPVRIKKLKPEQLGLLAPIVYIDLFKKDKKSAKEALLEGVGEKNVSRTPPPYPGKR